MLSWVAAATAVLLAPQSAIAFEGEAPARAVRDVVYRQIGDTALHLDAYIHPAAAKSPVPVLIHFHGGGWTRGARPDDWAGFRSYLDSGFSVVTVQYRLAGEAKAPAAVEDARCALHWVEANAAALGFDSDRIVISGTSAGAHLALMAGLLPETNAIDAPECRSPPRAAAIIDHYGPTDLAAMGARSGGLHPTVTNWIGAHPDAADLVRQMSPVNWLSASSPPIFIAHGDADPVVPVAQSQMLARRLGELGVAHDLFIAPQGGHGKFDAASRDAMTKRIFAFLCALEIVDKGACSDEN
jgi:acetyl esterase/lipase